MGVSSPLQQVKTSAWQDVAIWEWVGTYDEHVMSLEDNYNKWWEWWAGGSMKKRIYYGCLYKDTSVYMQPEDKVIS